MLQYIAYQNKIFINKKVFVRRIITLNSIYLKIKKKYNYNKCTIKNNLCIFNISDVLFYFLRKKIIYIVKLMCR